MTAGRAPLAGTVVVDLTHALAGPYCTRILRDLGARVIKVEPRGRTKRKGDETRLTLPLLPDGEESTRSAYFAFINSGKESICLDLKNSAEDKRTLGGLLSVADVLVENYRPGVLKRLGMTWESLHAQYPALVLASVSGFGQTGPYSQKAAVDTIIQAMAGMISVTGSEGGEPVRVGTSVSDMAAGMYAAIGIQAALLARGRDGAGRRVDISMLDASVSLMGVQLGQYHATGAVPGPIGNRHPIAAPFDVFEAAGGKYFTVSGQRPAWYGKFCAVVGLPHLATDPRYATNKLRLENWGIMRPQLAKAFLARPREHWLSEFERVGLPCGPVNDMADIAKDPGLVARNMLQRTTDGRHFVPGNPVKILGAPDSAQRPPPRATDADAEAVRRFADAALRSAAADDAAADGGAAAGQLQEMTADLVGKVPPLQAMGLRVAAASAGEVTVRAPLERNLNRGGTGFAGSLYSLCAAAGATLVNSRVSAHGAAARAVCKDASIKYLRPAAGPLLTATARFADPGAVPAFLSGLSESGRSMVRVTGEVTSGGKVCCTFGAEYHSSPAHLPDAMRRAKL